MNEPIDVAKWLERVRENRPLVHNITNLVVTNIAANALLAIGASPVMAYAKQEVGDMAKMASGLSLNMGTLDDAVVESMLIAGRAANSVGVPVIFDPVGVGATRYRNEVAEDVVAQLKLSILRGNAGEIGILLGAGGWVKGVDSSGVADNLGATMVEFAHNHGCVVIATGETDYVTDGDTLWALRNGHPLLAAITGSGCMITAVLGAFAGVAGRHAVPRDYAHAAIAALTCYNVAGELAGGRAQGPGTFQADLFDALYHLDGAYVNECAQIEVIAGGGD